MLNTGDVLDQKYRVIRLIGEGGMGAVYEAEFEAIRRRVAVKVLFPGFANDPDAVLRFHREAQAAGRIGHDNICEVMDIGQLPVGSPYLVMPLLKGEPLSETIRRDAPLAFDRAVDIASQVLDALGAAHRAQIAHRDLKPDNLFVTRLGDRGIEFIKVLDFGISKILGSASVNDQKQVTKTGMVLGTPSYMAPEQARGMKDVDHRADLYALGTILFEMLTGKRAFDGETYNEVLIKVVVDPVPAPRELRPEIPFELEAVIVRAMDRDRARRYQSADEFRRELLLALDLVHATGRRSVLEPTALAMPVPAAPAARPASVAQAAAPLPLGIQASPPAAGPGPAVPGPVVSSASVAATPDGTLAGRSSQTTVGAPRRRGRMIAALAGVAVLLAVGLAFLLMRGGGHPTEDGSTPNPAVTTAIEPAAPVEPAARPPAATVASAMPTPSVRGLPSSPPSTVSPSGPALPSAQAPEPDATSATAPPALAAPSVPPAPAVVPPAVPAPPSAVAPLAVSPRDTTGPAPAAHAADAGHLARPASSPPATVRVTFEGLPGGARVMLGGTPVEGDATTVPRSTTALVLAVSAAGFEPYHDDVVPSADRLVHVRMRHVTAVASSPHDAGANDAGRADARTISGRLGTMVVDDQEGPQP